MLADYMSVGKNQILAKVVTTSLETLASKPIAIIKKPALKILVHLTATKPHVLPETKIMQVKHFEFDLPSLI